MTRTRRHGLDRRPTARRWAPTMTSGPHLSPRERAGPALEQIDVRQQVLVHYLRAASPFALQVGRLRLEHDEPAIGRDARAPAAPVGLARDDARDERRAVEKRDIRAPNVWATADLLPCEHHHPSIATQMRVERRSGVATAETGRDSRRQVPHPDRGDHGLRRACRFGSERSGRRERDQVPIGAERGRELWPVDGCRPSLPTLARLTSPVSSRAR